MFRVYHSNQLDVLKSLLAHLIQLSPLQPALAAETILVQSPGMAQWLKQALAQDLGVATNIVFPLPSSFIWQMFHQVLPEGRYSPQRQDLVPVLVSATAPCRGFAPE
jgi:exodeoxyribonuclease V gamma subunit